MKGKDNKTIEAKFRNKFVKYNERYCKVCDDMRSLIKDFVVMRGGLYMFETYQPYVIQKRLTLSVSVVNIVKQGYMRYVSRIMISTYTSMQRLIWLLQRKVC